MGYPKYDDNMILFYFTILETFLNIIYFSLELMRCTIPELICPPFSLYSTFLFLYYNDLLSYYLNAQIKIS